jgi:hypothetical protein
MVFTGIRLRSLRCLFASGLIVIFQFSCAQVTENKKSLTDCDKTISIVGIFSPCNPDTVSVSALRNGINLSLNDTSYHITSFTLSYATREDEFISKRFRGDTALYNSEDQFWKRINEAQAVFLDEIRVRHDSVNRQLPAVVKYVK